MIDSSSRQSFVQTIFFHPMLAISLVLHGAILFMPLPAPAEPPLEAEEIEEEPVELSLESLIAPPPAPSPSPPAAPPQPTVTVTAAPPPVVQAQPIYTPPPQPEPTPEPTPDASPVEDSPEVEASPTENVATTTPPPEEDVPFDPLPFQDAFASSLDGLQGMLPPNIRPNPDSFEAPESFFQAGTEDPLPGVNQIRWLNDRRPDEVSADLLARYSGAEANAMLVEIPDGYGGGDLFEIQTADGQTIGYLNVAPSKGRVSTFLVVWTHNPNEPPPDNASSPM